MIHWLKHLFGMNEGYIEVFDSEHANLRFIFFRCRQCMSLTLLDHKTIRATESKVSAETPAITKTIEGESKNGEV